MSEKEPVRLGPVGVIRTRICTTCGCKGSGSCGRAIQISDGSVLPTRDTGYRHTLEKMYRSISAGIPVKVV